MKGKREKRSWYVVILILFLFTVGCERKNNITTGNPSSKEDVSTKEGENQEVQNQEGQNQVTESEGIVTDNSYIDRKEEDKEIIQVIIEDKPLNIIDDNYRTYYEVFLYSFYDSNGDGIGDINGLIHKLDYIAEMGFNGIWLMPIMPSSTYHKYDVENYYEIDDEYGTLEDFQNLIKACNQRNIKLIIDLVVNHSSNLHPWFQSALRSLEIEPCGKEICVHENLCREHNQHVSYYNFYKGKPVNGSYYHTKVGDWYYEGAFTSNMPDLNLADDKLRQELQDIIRFWIELGVGGFRLDAAMHFFDGDTERNVEALKFINDYAKSLDPTIYIVAEIWTNFSKYVRYYESGIDSVFNFAFATETGMIAKTLNSVNNHSVGKAYAEAMKQVEQGILKNHSNGMDASFFTNHDTARGAGYFMDNVSKVKMAQGMNLMMSGSSFVYYGEELGMSGSGRDENKRAPMYWSKEKIEGTTDGPKDMERITHNYGSLEEQIKDPSSIYHYVKRGIRLRNENPEIARGMITEIIPFDDNRITMVKKEYNGEILYVLYNFTGEEVTLDIKDKIGSSVNIQGYLLVDEHKIMYKGERLVVSPYGIILLK